MPRADKLPYATLRCRLPPYAAATFADAAADFHDMPRLLPLLMISAACLMPRHAAKDGCLMMPCCCYERVERRSARMRERIAASCFTRTRAKRVWRDASARAAAVLMRAARDAYAHAERDAIITRCR